MKLLQAKDPKKARVVTMVKEFFKSEDDPE